MTRNSIVSVIDAMCGSINVDKIPSRRWSGVAARMITGRIVKNSILVGDHFFFVKFSSPSIPSSDDLKLKILLLLLLKPTRCFGSSSDVGPAFFFSSLLPSTAGVGSFTWSSFSSELATEASADPSSVPSLRSASTGTVADTSCWIFDGSSFVFEKDWGIDTKLFAASILLSLDDVASTAETFVCATSFAVEATDCCCFCWRRNVLNADVGLCSNESLCGIVCNLADFPPSSTAEVAVFFLSFIFGESFAVGFTTFVASISFGFLMRISIGGIIWIIGFGDSFFFFFFSFCCFSSAHFFSCMAASS